MAGPNLDPEVLAHLEWLGFVRPIGPSCRLQRSSVQERSSTGVTAKANGSCVRELKSVRSMRKKALTCACAISAAVP